MIFKFDNYFANARVPHIVYPISLTREIRISYRISDTIYALIGNVETGSRNPKVAQG